MDTSKSRKSDAAATRKRRSSILKSQRAPRAPLSELEFHVATPQDSAKSRRVSFSRRTGVAEFEINDATTAWKSVYEEHNKSLETSGHESGGARPRRVQHLAGRSAALFQDAEAELVAEDEPPARAEAELSPLTERRTADVFRLAVDVTRGSTGRLDLDFSAVAPLDDLDALRRDLDERRGNISEYDIEVDFNATHITLKADDSDDMSITDSVHSPRVAAVEKTPPDWTADKENIVVNPYVAPPPADFAGDDDDVLVFDGKKCKFQSNLSDDESVKPSDASRKTIIYDTEGDLSVTRAVADRVLLPADHSLGLGVGSKTVFFDDVADMTVTGAVPAQILQQKADLRLVSGDERVLASNETRRQTIVYENENADISVTQALPANIIAPIQIAYDSNVVPERPESRTEKQTIYFDDIADISVTQTLPANIIQREPECNERDVAVKQTAPFLDQRDSARATLLGDEVTQPHTDRRKTIVYGNDDGDLSVTHALPANILNKDEATNAANTGRRTSIVYGNDDCDVSITGVVPANIMVNSDAKPAQSENARRRTIVYDNDDGNISMTGVVPANIMVNEVEAKRTEPAGTDRRRTIVYGNDDDNISMTGVVPANIMVEREVTLASTDRMKTVYGNEDDNVSMTGVVPANIMVDEKSNKLELPTTTERRKTVVFGNDDGNLSVTGVVPTNIMVDEVIAKSTIHTSTERRKTVVFGNDDGNLSMTGVVPVNVIVDEQVKSTEEMKTTDRRKTIVYGNDDGNISVTGVVPANIIVDKGETMPESASNERRKTIVYGVDEGEISMTGVVPANIMVDKDGHQNRPTNLERTRTIAYGNNDGDVSTIGVVPPHIVVTEELEDGAKLVQPSNTECRRTVVYESEDGDVSMMGVVPADIIVDDRVGQSQHTYTERRTVVDGNDIGNISMKGVVPATDLLTEEKEDRANPTQPSTERKKNIVYGNGEGNLSMTGVVPGNMTADTSGVNHTQPIPTERRKTIVYENEDDISVTGVVPADIMEEANRASNTERRKTIVYEIDEGNLSMTGVVPGNVTADIGGVNLTQPIPTERRKTIVYENDEGNLSMTGVVPVNVTADIGGANHTQPIPTERRKTIVYENDDDISMTGVVPADIIEEANRATNTERRKTVVNENDDNISMAGVDQAPFIVTKKNEDAVEIIKENTDHGDEEGDVSMTEVETRSHSLCPLQTQPIEPEDIVYEDKNDQISMTAGPRSPSVESHDDISMQTSAVSRQSLANKLYGDLSLSNTNASTFLKSPGKVVVYEASTRGEISRIQDDDKGSLSTYGNVSPDRSVDTLILTSNRVSKIDVQSHKSDDFEAMCTATIDAFSRSLAAQQPSPRSETSTPDSVSMLDPLSRDRPDLDESHSPDRMAFGVLARGLAPDRASILEELARSPPVSVLDALLDMSSMDDELVAADSCLLVNDSDEAIDEGVDRDVQTTTPPEYEENHELGDRSRRVSERKNESVHCEFPKKEDTRVETEDVERDEGNQTQWPTNCVGTQADDTKAILDALDRFTETRRSGDLPRRSLAPDRRSMLRSRDDLLKDISMARALMEIETERSDSSDEEPEPPEVVKTLRFDDDSVRESPGVLRKPAATEASSPTRRSVVIPPYMSDVGDIKDLMEELVKPTADAAPRRPPARHSGIQTDGLLSSQIDLPEAQYRASGPAPRESPREAEKPRARTPSPLARLSRASVLVFDRRNPLNNVALPPAAGAPHGYSPPREGGVAARSSARPSLEPAPDPHDRAVFAVHVVKHERAGPDVTPMDDDEPVEHRSPARVAFKLGSSEEGGEARKREYSPAEPSCHELTPKPAIKVQRISTTPQAPRRRSASPRSPGDLAVQQLLSEFHLSDSAASSVGAPPRTASPHEARSADDVRDDAGADVINRISMLPFMGTECSWETRSGDTWTFRLLRSRLRLVVRLAHGVRRARARTAVVLAVVQHAHAHDGSDPVALWCVRLAAEALQQLALDVRSAGALPAALRAAVALCRRALRWARALHHARGQLACSLDDSGRLALKVANIPLRCVWEVTLRVELAAGGGGAAGAWPRAAGAWPRAADVRVAPVLASWAPGARDLERLLAPLPQDWGHVPRTIWKVFKYLKHKQLEDDELLVGAARGR